MKWFKRWLCFNLWPNDLCCCGDHSTPETRRAVTKSTEILPGVQKPSLVLAQMLCGKMLANPDYTVKREDGAPKLRGLPDPMCWRWTETATFRGDGYHIEFSSTEYSGMYTSPIRKVNVILPVGVSFDGPERQLLWDTMNKVEKLKRERDAADEETKRQEKAVKAIADFFVTEENP